MYDSCVDDSCLPLPSRLFLVNYNSGHDFGSCLEVLQGCPVVRIAVNDFRKLPGVELELLSSIFAYCYRASYVNTLQRCRLFTKEQGNRLYSNCSTYGQPCIAVAACLSAEYCLDLASPEDESSRTSWLPSAFLGCLNWAEIAALRPQRFLSFASPS